MTSGPWLTYNIAMIGLARVWALSSFYNPAYTFVGIAAIGVVAWFAGRTVPFYRSELRREGATRLTQLDGLRGILCFAVMFHHAAVTRVYLQTGVWDSPSSPLYRLFGETSVALFFCVTGFLFFSRILAVEGRIEPWSFLRARWFRVVPMYAVSAVIVIAVVARHVVWLSPTTVKGLVEMAKMGIRPWYYLGGPVNVSEVDAGVTSTLQAEWAFYFAVPVLAVLVLAAQPKRLLFAAAALWVLIGQDRYDFFISGILAAYAVRDAKVAARLRRPDVSVLVLAVFILLPLLTHDGYGPRALLCTTVVFIPIACGNNLFGLLDLAGLRVMGIVSYSVYLLHGIFLYVSRRTLSRWTGGSSDDNLHYWAATTMLGFGVLVVSLASYRWVEFPCVRFEKRWRRTPRTDELVRAELDATKTAPTLPGSPA